LDHLKGGSDYICRGYNIGIRLIDEFLAKSNSAKCTDFRETADVIAKVSESPPLTYFHRGKLCKQQSGGGGSAANSELSCLAFYPTGIQGVQPKAQLM
jgi:hypothetical protein